VDQLIVELVTRTSVCKKFTNRGSLKFDEPRFKGVTNFYLLKQINFVQTKISHTPGPGQTSTTLITFQGALKLIMALPGINARDVRTKFMTSLLHRFPELNDVSMEIVPEVPQPVRNAVLEERDEHGNLIMRLNDIGLDAYVRYQRYEDGVRLAEIDVVKAVTGKSVDYSGHIIRNLSEDVKNELRDKHSTFKFKGVCKVYLLKYVNYIQTKISHTSGPGQKSTTLITFQGTLKLIMALPGINARDIRTKFVTSLLHRFPELNDVSMEIVPEVPQPVENAVLEERDEHGNLIMRLNDIGLDAYVRYQRYEDGVRLAEIDVVKAVTGKSVDYSGQIIRNLSEDVKNEVRDKHSTFKFKGVL
jgi:hypothetical protein